MSVEDFYRVRSGSRSRSFDEWGDGEASAVFEFRARLKNPDGERFTLQDPFPVGIEDGRSSPVRWQEEAPVPAAAGGADRERRRGLRP